jgi:hypothetical protein
MQKGAGLQAALKSSKIRTADTPAVFALEDYVVAHTLYVVAHT